MSATPSQFAAVSFSLRNTAPKIATSTTLSLSIGATRAASPSCKARKNQIHDAPVASPESARNR